MQVITYVSVAPQCNPLLFGNMYMYICVMYLVKDEII